MSLSPATFSSFSGVSREVPRPDEIYNFSSVSWVYPETSNLLEEAS